MKRIFLTFILAGCALTLAAQDGIRVNYKGAKPTITDFACAMLFSDDEDEDECDQEATAGIELALTHYLNGEPQEEGATLIVDERNGYLRYEWRYEGGEYLHTTEMCFWNEADKKHKLFAYSNWCFENGVPAMGQYDTLTFYRYNNATKRMSMCEAPGFEVEYFQTGYSLPRTGKDIIVTKWYDDGSRKQHTLKWDGRKFRR